MTQAEVASLLDEIGPLDRKSASRLDSMLVSPTVVATMPLTETLRDRLFLAILAASRNAQAIQDWSLEARLLEKAMACGMLDRNSKVRLAKLFKDNGRHDPSAQLLYDEVARTRP